MSPGLLLIDGGIATMGGGLFIDTAGVDCCCEPQADGACCFYELPGQPCVVTSVAICKGAGGTFMGAGTICTPGLCDLPTACCFSDRSCIVATPTECLGLGGTPQPPGTSCLPNPCIQPRACCFNDGTCQDLLPVDCAAAGGIVQAQGTTCATTNCPVDPCDLCSSQCPPATTATVSLPEYTFTCSGITCTIPACTVVLPASQCGLVAQNFPGCPTGACLPNGTTGRWQTVIITCGPNPPGPPGTWRLSANYDCGATPPCGSQSFCWGKAGACPTGTYSWLGFLPGCPGLPANCGGNGAPGPGPATAVFS